MRIKSFKTVAVKILLLTMIFVSDLQAQEIETIRKITGTVTDNLGNPVAGANIVIQETDKGVVSDFSGNYSINISSQSDVLGFSFIGFQKQEITVGERDTINVVMDEGEMIEPAKPINLTQKQREKVEADNRFAFKMFNEISKLEGNNTFFSPFSLNMAM